MTVYFDGPGVDEADTSRLAKQLVQVRVLMADGNWRALFEISELLGYPEASISARIRDLRKARFGSHTVESRRRSQGLHEYRLILNTEGVDSSKWKPSRRDLEFRIIDLEAANAALRAEIELLKNRQATTQPHVRQLDLHGIWK